MIKVNAIIEIVGKPKEHVNEVMDKIISLLEKSDKFKLLNKNIHEIKSIPQSAEIFSTFGEFEIDFPNIDSISLFCFDYMPSSIEILEPENLKIKSTDVSNFFNDIIAKIHQYDMVLKNFILKEKAAAKNKTKKS